jgi:hypothetical protein
MDREPSGNSAVRRLWRVLITGSGWVWVPSQQRLNRLTSGFSEHPAPTLKI